MQSELTPNPSGPFLNISGIFYRSINALAANKVLAGSTRPGRYSSGSQKTLYMSASKQGVAVSMQAHTHADAPEQTLLKLNVVANNIFDLRDALACQTAGIDPADANAPWQKTVATGGTPPSWQVANMLRKLGANGLIDPSRNAPDLWHLVLFNWNTENHSVVTVI